MRPAHSGFTLLELLVVIAIAAVLTGLAIPSFRSGIQSAEVRSAATAFYTSLNRARSEAIARNTTVSICARDITQLNTPTCLNGSTAWQNGWILYTGSSPSSPIEIHEQIADSLRLSNVTSPLQFGSTGQVSVSTTFNLCRSPSDNKGRNLVVTRSGRVSLEPGSC